MLAWAQGSVCVFPQDYLDPLGVPECLMRKVQARTEATQEGTDMPGDPESAPHPLNGKSNSRASMGILSAFPKLRPVRHDAQDFPCLFTTNNKLNLPFLPLDADSAFIGENRSLSEEGSLCSTVNPHANSFLYFFVLIQNRMV